MKIGFAGSPLSHPLTFLSKRDWIMSEQLPTTGARGSVPASASFICAVPGGPAASGTYTVQTFVLSTWLLIKLDSFI